jgi:hypothetical protein
MSAIVLRRGQGAADIAVGQPRRPDVLIRCTGGMWLRVPQHALRGRRGAAPKTEPKLRQLLREVIAFKRVKKK